MDWYKVVGADRQSSADEIRKLYHDKIKALHPDKVTKENHTETSREEFLQVQEAWEILRDPEKRRQYDLQLGLGSNATEVDLDDIPYNGEKEVFDYKCRCGDSILITVGNLEEGLDLFECSSCSLRIHVLYEDAEATD
uniref:Diphthamide biosynthesis protein 4 n=1 Tax=Aplanochytrium stocchinoi TaxID=215587 RepID=A0A7S3PA94_9STRA|mmetsp:Transcript_5832/g.7358  ORF Transcript_5832/g.7358 Transcript_5832/m.7358 type:complete len:138 (+) Transcript_5832:191-604(+)|eukprot:CAMPEP_0204855236 /NCGR_PEP_ID=MMETSP1347-20130617/16430_1 /ASSEMBLY_ACC=CAM_ASM_000690 /TAXON_ID=215587 /ORGANISM="Aplanochytrium stocchinoi, Strain GSBS06" /LENGTH=137 /DNA_ID=CAMNT_0052001249 /DNA_START=96 /DNA_END=509 /DNA_ORIENTATION=+